ncbi:MAG: VWA domain-containing protein [Candidatus Omnitrophica bacterium]|nr:VWA domain-containing protein [Candidatus Omnitrophota bacterium]MCM8790433.1 VWA domain-containing protein [Candidatus Omnitrophota bacterium]
MQYANQSYFSMIVPAMVAIIAFYLWALARKRARLERFADRRLVADIAPSMSIALRITKMTMIILAVCLCLVALARPQWGFVWEEVKRTGIDMLIAIDVSKSMLATDVKPDRLERSKFAVKDLVKKLDGDRVGLVAFAGTTFLQCPLTIDYNGFLLALDDLTIGTIPRGGTCISCAIKEAISVLKGPDSKYKVLVIITDGEDLEGDALRAAKEAADLGIKIYCVGVGSTEGELIPVTGGDGSRGYLTDRSGQVVKSRLNEEILKKIAISTGGSYVRATQSEFGLLLLYDKSISKLEKRDIEAKMRKHYQERYQYFLGLAVFLLFLEPMIPERKRIAPWPG